MKFQVKSVSVFATLFLALVIQTGNAFAQSQSSSVLDRLGQTAKQADELEPNVLKTLKSFRKVDDHPLFEMQFVGDYVADKPRNISSSSTNNASGWACSLFVSYSADGKAMYGRNFDWQHNPALLLHTKPSKAYASISMVDISYLGFSKNDKKFDSLEGRKALMQAPLLPFDGMNEHGLVVGMAAVGDTKLPSDADRPNVGSLQIIRLMLDRAKTTEGAIEVFDQFNVVKSGGPNIHYLVADAKGKSAVIELKDGRTNVIRGKSNWQSATNFYLTGQDKPLKQCPRFAKIDQLMTLNKGSLNAVQTMDLLKDVSQRNTQWSVVYDMKKRTANVSTGRNFEEKFVFKIEVNSDQP